MTPRVLAVDWSGAKKGAGGKIWLAEVAGGRLQRLEHGRGRSELVRHLIAQAEDDPRLVVGFDFAFSFPEWFLDEHGAQSAPEVWDVVDRLGEEWLGECPSPFWGKTGRPKPELPSHFRRTELEAQDVAGAQPKSVFQVGGAGAVGTGSLRGMPHLAELADAGFSVWPFHEPGWPRVVEIYPRLLTGAVVKSDPTARTSYLDGALPEIPRDLASVAAASEDALDAAVSAVVMARHLDEIEALGLPNDPVIRKEGAIWSPSGAARGPLERSRGRSAGAGSSSAAPSDCPFCSLDPDDVVARSDHGFAIRDAFPVSQGHTLVIPREHVGRVFDLPMEAQHDLWSLVARARDALVEELGVRDFNIGVNDGEAAGQTVPHAHIHVIPRTAGDVSDPRGGIRWVKPEQAPYWDG